MLSSLTIVTGKENTMTDECEKASTNKLNNKSHPCTQCGRIFESGKALGGHVSAAHVQPKKDLQGQKLKCQHCEKEFDTAKAMHGHMRAHPQGGTKAKKAKTNSKDPKTCSTGLGQASGKGIQSGKRPRPMTSGHGCNNTHEHETFDDVQSSSGETLVVNVNKPTLLGYVTGDQWYNQTHDSATRKLLQLTSSDSSANDKNVVNSSQGPRQFNQINNPILELKQQMGDISSLKQQTGGISSRKVIISEHHGATNGNNDVAKISTPDDLAKFPCTLCNLSFTSYQALGGHKASHFRNNKAHHVNTVDEQRNKQQQNAKSSHNSHSGLDGVSSEQGPSTHAQLHRCNPCNKNFETYRGLKTHERSEGHAQVLPSHVTTSGSSVEFSGPVSISPSYVTTPNSRLEINGAVGNPRSNVATSSASESDQPPPRCALSFDLNVPLEMEE